MVRITYEGGEVSYFFFGLTLQHFNHSQRVLRFAPQLCTMLAEGNQPLGEIFYQVGDRGGVPWGRGGGGRWKGQVEGAGGTRGGVNLTSYRVPQARCPARARRACFGQIPAFPSLMKSLP